MDRRINNGLIFIMAFDMLSAAQSVWLGSLLQGVPVKHSLLAIFSIVAGFFLLLTFYRRDPWPPLDKQRLMLFAGLNLGTLATWLFLYESLRFVEPAMTAAVLYGANPIATLLITLILAGSLRGLTMGRFLVGIATVASMWMVAHTVLQGNSGMGRQDSETSLYGLLMALLTGCAMALVNVISKRIYDQGYKLHQLMSMRFFLLIAVCAFYSQGIGETLVHSGWAFLIIALLGNVVPLYCLQKGISMSEPALVSYVLLLTPILVFVFQLFDNRLILSGYSILAIAVVLFFAMLGLKVERQALQKQ
ncbi:MULTISPECIES: hypothetical protein [Pseudomonas]|jgi:drug/metabolite transporter (DMT)-like permease|uniref:hypothetical protein n=1 Tax=Pseudomonas TaxID=286 RepID=UPI000812433B|nr:MULTISPECIES: hypothetical protein [Pseudomonas]MDO4237002.1 hypothetical protein [Pseudomonas sp.]RZI24663.1 hypothetical protein EUX53_09955 [Pseudomonas orientalis]CRL98413.1 EamA-like transporter family protein [Pseudomonas sp. 28 E 9]